MKGQLIAPQAAPPVRELPEPFKRIVLDDKFPALARWINSDVSFASLYFAGSNNNAHNVRGGEHAVTARSMSVRPDNEASNHGVRLLCTTSRPALALTSRHARRTWQAARSACAARTRRAAG